MANSGKAWNQAPIQEPSTPPTSGMSFVAIQQLQLEQVIGHSKDKRSLREIQEEEQALQQEADFLAWWTAEEERVRLEAEIAVPQNPQPKPTKKGKKASSRGRGDGGPGRKKNEAS